MPSRPEPSIAPAPEMPTSAAALHLHLHGDPRIEPRGARPVPLERRAAALCALAALDPGTARERGAQWLWPDADDPRGNLRQQLLRFRRALPAPLLADGDRLALAPGVELVAPAAGEVLLGALDYTDCPAFADWLEARRTAERTARTATLRAALAEAEAASDLDAARAAAEALHRVEPDSEAAHRELMRVHYLRGDNAAGLDVHAGLLRALAARGAQPHADTQALARALRDAGTPPVPVPPRATAATLLRPPRLVGRAAEQAALQAAWATGRVVLLVGEAGMGKSRLLDEIARGEPVVVVQGRPGDAAIPYATLARLLGRLLAHAGHAPEAAQTRELARVLPEFAPATPLPADGDRLVLQRAVQQLVERAAPRAIAVDDLHFADNASVDLLLALTGDAPAGLDWLFAQRPAEGGASARVLADTLQEAGRLAVVALLPLDAAAMAELVDSIGLPGLGGAAVAAELVRRTGGNPLFALETLKHGFGPGARPGLPQSVGALIERRLRQISPPALKLARLAAVAGVDFDARLAEAVLGAGALALADRWGELEAAQVLRGDAFAHDLVHEATLRSLPAPLAARIHGEVAAHLEGRQAEPARIAAHWQAAGEGLRAVPHLVAAAERALAGFQPGMAAALHETAADLLLAADRHDEAFQRLFEASAAQGRLSDGARLVALRDRLLGLARSPRQRAMAQTMAGRVADFLGDYAALEACGRAVLAFAVPEGDLELEALAQSFIGAAAYWTGRSADAVAPMTRVRDCWRALGNRQAAAETAQYVAVILTRVRRFGDARRLMDETAVELEALQAWRELALVTRERSNFREDAGDFEGQRALLGQAARLLDRIDAGAETWTYVTVSSARALRSLGRYAAALETLDAHAQRFPEQAGGLVGALSLLRAMVMEDLGRPHNAAQALGATLAAPGLPTAYRGVAAALQLRLWAAGHLGGARPAEVAAGDEVRVQIELALAQLALEPAAARAQGLRAVEAEAAGFDMHAQARAALAARVLALHEAGDAAGAADEALRLRDGLAAGGIAGYPPLAWWAVAYALHDRVPGAATAALRVGVEWIAAAVAADLPAAYADSFLNRNPVNRNLLAAAAREAALAPAVAALRAARAAR